MAARASAGWVSSSGQSKESEAPRVGGREGWGGDDVVTSPAVKEEEEEEGVDEMMVVVEEEGAGGGRERRREKRAGFPPMRPRFKSWARPGVCS